MRVFYANINFETQSYVVIRGGKVSFSAKTINMKLGLENVEDEYSLILKKVTEKQLQQIKKDLAFARAEWIQ